MTSRRMLKAASAIREVVSMAILTELKDPRVQNVTVTYVEVAPDMRTAKVHVSVMGNDTQQTLSLRGLESSAGFLQQRVSKMIDTRYTPRLQFVLDKGVKHSIEVARMLRELLPGDAAAAAPTDDTADDDATDDEPHAEHDDSEDDHSEDDTDVMAEDEPAAVEPREQNQK